MAMHRKAVPTTPRRPQPIQVAGKPTDKQIPKAVVSGSASKNGSSTLKK